MDERLRFVARLLEGEKMAPLCAEFGISRKTGYKDFGPLPDCGVAAFTDRSRRSYCQAIGWRRRSRRSSRLKREYPGWGAPRSAKLRREVTARHLPPSARCMRCSIDTAWSIAVGGAVRAPVGPRSPGRPCPMRSGVPTTRANFGSGTSAIATR